MWTRRLNSPKTVQDTLLFLIAFLFLTLTANAASYSPAASLSIARQYHSATLLPNNKVLVVGGQGAGAAYLSSAETYDETNNTWTTVASLTTTRASHTATRLSNGKVLIVAGFNGAYLRTSELYDSTNNTWAAAGSLTTARSYHSATLLDNGKVLIVGGQGTGSYLNTVELYDPATNTWSAAASLGTARAYHTATLLSGKVLVTGGYNGAYLSSAELYDPASNTWNSVASLSAARRSHTATLMQNGKVLVAGGTNGSDLNTTAIYDPANNSWSAAANLADPREGHTAILMSKGRVFIAGGINNGYILTRGESYDPVSNQWSSAFSSSGHVWHSATLLPSGKVLVAAGYANSYTTSAEIYDDPVYVTTTSATTTSASYGVLFLTKVSATVTSPGGPVNQGTVTFQITDGASNIGTAMTSGTVTAGAASAGPYNLPAGLPAGSYSINATYNPGLDYYGSSDTGNSKLNITKATATVTLGNLSQVYDGTPKSATATTTPAGLAVSFTYNGSATAPVAAGSYTVVGTINDQNYQGSATGTMTIKVLPAATVTLSNLTQAYDGTPKSATATTVPANLTVSITYDGLPTPPVNAGSYAVAAQVTDPNYQGSASGTLVISKAAATVTLGNLVQRFDGAPKPVTANTQPPNLTVGVTYNGAATAPSAVGKYAVVATVNDKNFQGTAAGTLTIANPPAITSPLTASGQVNDIFSYTITASGVDPVTFTATGLPDGIVLSGSTLIGVPVTSGQYAVTLSVADAIGTSVSSLVISISGSSKPKPSTLVLNKGKMSLNFQKSAADSTQLQGLLTLPQSLTLANQTINFNFGGVKGSLQLDTNEKSPLGGPALKFKAKKHKVGAPLPAGSQLLLSASLKGSFSKYLDLRGVAVLNQDSPESGNPAGIYSTLKIGDSLFVDPQANGIWKAKQSKSGVFTLGKTDAEPIALLLGVTGARPGEVLRLQASGLDPSAVTFVEYRDLSGNAIRVLASEITDSSVSVAIPPYVNRDTLNIEPGVVSISILQQRREGISTYITSDSFVIGELANTTEPSGTITLSVLSAIRDKTMVAKNKWSLIQKANISGVDVSALINDLGIFESNLTTISNAIQAITNGEADSISIGTRAGQSILMDKRFLSLVDSLIVTYSSTNRNGAFDTEKCESAARALIPLSGALTNLLETGKASQRDLAGKGEAIIDQITFTAVAITWGLFSQSADESAEEILTVPDKNEWRNNFRPILPDQLPRPYFSHSLVAYDSTSLVKPLNDANDAAIRMPTELPTQDVVNKITSPKFTISPLPLKTFTETVGGAKASAQVVDVKNTGVLNPNTGVPNPIVLVMTNPHSTWAHVVLPTKDNFQKLGVGFLEVTVDSSGLKPGSYSDYFTVRAHTQDQSGKLLQESAAQFININFTLTAAKTPPPPQPAGTKFDGLWQGKFDGTYIYNSGTVYPWAPEYFAFTVKDGIITADTPVQMKGEVYASGEAHWKETDSQSQTYEFSGTLNSDDTATGTWTLVITSEGQAGKGGGQWKASLFNAVKR